MIDIQFARLDDVNLAVALLASALMYSGLDAICGRYTGFYQIRTIFMHRTSTENQDICNVWAVQTGKSS